MRNLIQDGLIVNLPAPANVLPGDLVNVGSFIGVAETAAPAGSAVPTRLEGVFSDLGVNAAVGAPVYFDTTAGALTTTKSGNIPAGISLGGGKVRLVPTV